MISALMPPSCPPLPRRHDQTSIATRDSKRSTKATRRIHHSIHFSGRPRPMSYKYGLKNLHPSAAICIIESYAPKIVDGAPPAIASEEKQLPRATRTIFAQFRSGYWKILRNYQAKINPELDDDSYPDCNVSPHDTDNLL